eukprot:scaffold33375_cov53-Phaeocystis_antarctica.AAC.1
MAIVSVAAVPPAEGPAASWRKCPGSQPPVRPPAAPEGPPACSGLCPLRLRGAHSPLARHREAALRSVLCLPKVADPTAPVPVPSGEDQEGRPYSPTSLTYLTHLPYFITS